MCYEKYVLVLLAINGHVLQLGVTLEVIALFGLGCFPTEKDGNGPPPNLAIWSQMMMKLGMDILWVEIFSNW